MTERDDEALRRWLDAEADGAADAADASFRVVFRPLRLRGPSGGFVASVMAEVGRSSRHPAAWADAWWARILVATAVALAGLVAALQGPAVLAGAALAWLLRTVEVGARVADFVLTVLDRGLGLWAWLGAVGQTVSLILLAPPVVVFLAVNLLVAVAGVAFLRRLLGRQEGLA